MSHPQSLTGKQMPDIMHFQLQKMQIKRKKKACWCFSSRLLCCEAPQACGAVAAGVGAVPSLMAVTFLSSSSWLHCTAVDGACDSHAISWALQSAPSEPSLCTRLRSTRENALLPSHHHHHPTHADAPTQTAGTPRLSARPPQHPEASDHCWRTESSD